MTIDRYVIVIHTPTGRAYSLNRQYGVNQGDEPETPPPEKCVELWEEWEPSSPPDWTKQFPSHEFTAYWLY